MADADAYAHGLLVEFEGNKVPRLKTKLVKYFQSKKSRGGDCTVEHESGSRTAVLRFRTQQGKAPRPGLQTLIILFIYESEFTQSDMKCSE